MRVARITLTPNGTRSSHDEETDAMLHVYAMCGVAFAGKSTLARRIADEFSLSLSSLDAIDHERGLRGGEGMSIVQWEDAIAIAMDRLRRGLREGRSAMVAKSVCRGSHRSVPVDGFRRDANDRMSCAFSRRVSPASIVLARRLVFGIAGKC